MPLNSSKNEIPPPIFSGKNSRVKGLYVHVNPPKVLHLRCSLIRQWLQSGDITQLEQIVLQGQGHKLLGEHSSDPKTQSFLKQIPVYMDRIHKLNRALSAGNLKIFEKYMEDKKDDYMMNIFLSKNGAGLNFLHKAVFYGFPEIVKFLVSNFPQNINEKDKEGKTPLHYCGASKEANKIWHILIKGGADSKIRDRNGKLPYYYMQQPQDIRLFHNNIPEKNNFDSSKSNLDIKASNIRIWIHDQDFKNLRKVIWEGHGKKLQVETSNHPKIKRFLEGVPLVLNVIKDLHSAVVSNELDEFIKKSSEPVPIEVLGSKDRNGLNPLHKASGLGRLNIANYIIARNPKLIFSTDHDGRMPLHFAAALKNDDSLYNFLVRNGGDETICDKNGKTPHYYRINPKEIMSKILKVIPEAPRTTGMFPINWDWSLFHSNGSTPTTMMSTLLLNEADNIMQKNENDLEINSQVENSVKTNQKIDSVAENRPENLNELSSTNVDFDINKFTNESLDENTTLTLPKQESDYENTVTNLIEEDRILPQCSITGQTDSDVSEQLEESKKEENINIWANSNTAESEEKKNYEKPIEKQNNFYNQNEKEEVAEKEEKNFFDDSYYLPYNSEAGAIEIEKKKKAEREIAEERQRILDEREFKPEDRSNRIVAYDKVDKLIEMEDMEALALMVLNGEGEKLAGKTSINPGIQSFLDNLPSYMAKITAVHKAVRRGSVNALQVALDRRRFAVAKETSDKLGVTPLHVAVLFGKSSIIKYLGGKFPETLNSTDNYGRTPLHYAAVLPDKNHFFNMLLNLGADRKIEDEAGRTPQFYQENPGELSYEDLMEDFDAPGQLAKDMLKDQEYPFFGLHGGKYLADALGGPLVRGLTEIANKRPINAVAYLTNFLHDFLEDNAGISSPIADPSLEIAESETFFVEGKPLSKNEEAGSTEKISETVAASNNFTNNDRDEYGQSILHFAAARIHGRYGLYHLIQESKVNLGYRDELYRTARDIALQANIEDNIREIDNYVISLAARGKI